jgi:hypothetical protein
MSQSSTTHSGFAQFAAASDRDWFVQAVLSHDSLLQDRAHVSHRRATIVFEQLTDQQREQVIRALDGRGRWIEDVQFQTMS